MKVEDQRADLGPGYDFELGTKNTKYNPVSWSRLKAAIKADPHRMAEIYVRPALDNVWLDNFYQEFALDDASALRYAKRLIKDGIADSAWVEVRYRHAFRQHGAGRGVSRTLIHVDRE
jgi:hypothetical protein